MNGLLKRPAQITVNVIGASGLMANPKPKLADDETVKAMLAALAIYRSGERHE